MKIGLAMMSLTMDTPGNEGMINGTVLGDSLECMVWRYGLLVMITMR
jgi:hypothetical protein